MSVACDVEIKEEIKEEPLNFNEENSKDGRLCNKASVSEKSQTYANPIEAIYLPENIKEEKLDEDAESEQEHSNKQTSSAKPELRDNYLKKMEKHHIDSEKLIEQIEARPAIWDMSSKEYNDKALKKKTWEELATMFASENASLEEKKIIEISWKKRWKTLRDNFARELKKRKTTKSGSGSSNSTPYIYFTQLQFLESTVTNKGTINNLDDQNENTVHLEEQETPTEDLNIPEETANTSGSKKKVKLNAVDKHFDDNLNKSILLREQRDIEQKNEDEDKLFCLSLYKELKKIPDHVRLRTKIQLLETIQKAQDLYNPIPFNGQAHYQPLSIGMQYAQGNTVAFSTQASQPRVLPATSSAGSSQHHQLQYGPQHNMQYGNANSGASSAQGSRTQTPVPQATSPTESYTSQQGSDDIMDLY